MGTATGVQSVDNAIITMYKIFSDIYMYNLYNSINSTSRDSLDITIELDYCN